MGITKNICQGDSTLDFKATEARQWSKLNRMMEKNYSHLSEKSHLHFHLLLLFLSQWHLSYQKETRDQGVWYMLMDS